MPSLSLLVCCYGSGFQSEKYPTVSSLYWLSQSFCSTLQCVFDQDELFAFSLSLRTNVFSLIDVDVSSPKIRGCDANLFSCGQLICFFQLHQACLRVAASSLMFRVCVCILAAFRSSLIESHHLLASITMFWLPRIRVTDPPLCKIFARILALVDDARPRNQECLTLLIGDHHPLLVRTRMVQFIMTTATQCHVTGRITEVSTHHPVECAI